MTDVKCFFDKEVLAIIENLIEKFFSMILRYFMKYIDTNF